MNDITSAKTNTESFSPSINFEIKRIPYKRGFDIIFSFFTLIAIFPLLAIIIILIKTSSKGKIIYSHERIGRGGKPFKCYKFRTMYFDADHRLKELLAKDSSLQEEWLKHFKLKKDPRITSIGAFLRKTSLDELPQFWNVLKGDLSVVGPRPVVKEEIDRYLGANAAKILSIRPGLTGLWQVSGRSNTTYEQRIALDKEYIEKQSLWLDIKLIVKTIPAILFSRGAY